MRPRARHPSGLPTAGIICSVPTIRTMTIFRVASGTTHGTHGPKGHALARAGPLKAKVALDPSNMGCDKAGEPARVDLAPLIGDDCHSLFQGGVFRYETTGECPVRVR